MAATSSAPVCAHATVPPTLFTGGGADFRALQQGVLDILECAALHPLQDEGFQFRPMNLNGHRGSPPVSMVPHHYAKAPLGATEALGENAEFPIILNYRIRLRLRGRVGFRIKDNCPFRRPRYCSLQCDGAADRKRVEDRWNGHRTAILGQFQTSPYGEIISDNKKSLPCCGDRAESPKIGGAREMRSRSSKIYCSRFF